MWVKHSPRHPTERGGALLSAVFHNWEEFYVDTEHMGVCARCGVDTRVDGAHDFRDCAAVRGAGVPILRDVAAVLQHYAAHHVAVQWVWNGLSVSSGPAEIVIQWVAPAKVSQVDRGEGGGTGQWWPLFVGSLPAKGVLTAAKKILRAPPALICAEIAQVVCHAVRPSSTTRHEGRPLKKAVWDHPDPDLYCAWDPRVLLQPKSTRHVLVPRTVVEVMAQICEARSAFRVRLVRGRAGFGCVALAHHSVAVPSAEWSVTAAYAEEGPPTPKSTVMCCVVQPVVWVKWGGEQGWNQAGYASQVVRAAGMEVAVRVRTVAYAKREFPSEWGTILAKACA